MKNTNTQNVSASTLMDTLVFNNRFANRKITADQLGAENFDLWTKLIKDLHRNAYDIYAQCENSGMKVEDSQVDKTPIYNTVKLILDAIGEVNEHKLYANEETAILLVGYSGRRANADSPELQYCLSRISGLRNEIKKYEALNVTDTEYKAQKLAEMNAQLEKLNKEKATLIATADMRIKQPTMTSDSAFRLDTEHYFARVIVGQMAKTLEQLDAEELARKEARKAKAKARKAEKAKANA